MPSFTLECPNKPIILLFIRSDLSEKSPFHYLPALPCGFFNFISLNSSICFASKIEYAWP